jgi:hypothetical protein
MIKKMSDFFGVPENSIYIISWLTSRKKVIKIQNVWHLSYLMNLLVSCTDQTRPWPYDYVLVILWGNEGWTIVLIVINYSLFFPMYIWVGISRESRIIIPVTCILSLTQKPIPVRTLFNYLIAIIGRGNKLAWQQVFCLQSLRHLWHLSSRLSQGTTNKRGHDQIASEIQDTEDSIQPENGPTHPLMPTWTF